jgi:integrase
MSNQLVNIIKNEFKIFHYYSHINSELNTRSVKDLPFMRWPDRLPCIEANLFILSLFNRALSMRVKGGTLRTYAYNISHLIRFCFKNKINVSNLTDSSFTAFITWLQGEKNDFGVRIRSNNQVIKIGRTCIDFLVFVGNFHSLPNFIGKEEYNSIVVEEKKKQISKEGQKKTKIIFYWHHNSFPRPDTKKKRHPISNDALVKIKSVIVKNGDSKLVKRNTVLLQSYEQTGGRRTEVLLLEVNDVKQAFNSVLECPMLRLTTLKRKDLISERLVPVPRTFIINLMDYINTTRKRIIRKKIGLDKDHGYVFISHTTGKHLESDTISSYMIKWREEAGIDEQAFVHLIRHAYITEKLKCIILEHEFNNKDEFRKALLNTESFKIKLKEWTGHTHLSSLDVYIDLAFADLAGTRKTYNDVTLKSSVEVVKDSLDIFNANRKSRTITNDDIDYFNKIIEAFSVDIDRSLNSTQILVNKDFV